MYKAFYDERVDKCITTQLYVPTTLYFKKVYAVGVSMGSMGAFSMGVNYNDRFAGLVGTAGLTEIDYWDVSKIGKTPFLFVGGTEDTNGLDFMFYGIEKLNKLLPNFEYILTGGAVHGAEWKPCAQEIFEWLSKISK